ncbi:DUF5820 family protein [Halobacterium yunchengense]|uniref:DUF5820 family protein n=1 Tax=Halobacterium yunchengense TaxID=3108497 RepID=UPI003009A4ED
MTARDGLPEGWQVWNDDESGTILVYRPDVFDTRQFDAACLPTIRVTRRPPSERKRRPGSTPSGWFVSLRLEPEVRVRSADAHFDTRDAAEAGAVDLAERFAAGEVDYRGAYQLPREDYLDELDDLTGG